MHPATSPRPNSLKIQIARSRPRSFPPDPKMAKKPVTGELIWEFPAIKGLNIDLKIVGHLLSGPPQQGLPVYKNNHIQKTPQGISKIFAGPPLPCDQRYQRDPAGRRPKIEGNKPSCAPHYLQFGLAVFSPSLGRTPQTEGSWGNKLLQLDCCSWGRAHGAQKNKVPGQQRLTLAHVPDFCKAFLQKACCGNRSHAGSMALVAQEAFFMFLEKLVQTTARAQMFSWTSVLVAKQEFVYALMYVLECLFEICCNAL